MEQRTFLVIRNSELNDLVHEHCPGQQGYDAYLGGFTFYTTIIEGVGLPKKYDSPAAENEAKKRREKDLALFVAWSNGKHVEGMSARDILNGLHAKGVIPAGDYLFP